MFRRLFAKNELLDLVKDIASDSFSGINKEDMIDSVVDHICDAVHEEIRKWLRDEGVIE